MIFTAMKKYNFLTFYESIYIDINWKTLTYRVIILKEQKRKK